MKRFLKELIETSDQPLTLPIKWEGVVGFLFFFISSFETPLALFLSTIGHMVVRRRVDIGISVVQSTLNNLISRGGGSLQSVSIVWSVESLLEPGQEVDLCCVIVWCIVERSSLL